MTVALQFVKCVDFPAVRLNRALSTEVQTALPWGDQSAQTSLRYRGSAEGGMFERYEVLHQVERDIDAFYDQRPVKRLLVNGRFAAFYNRSGGYFLINSRRSDARGVFDRLAKEHPGAAASYDEIDLTQVLGLGSTTGAYFGNLRIEKVRSAAVFGTTTIVESDEWEHYAERGELSAVYMRVFEDDGGVRAVQLLRDRGVVLMKDLGERLNLAFVAALQASIDHLLA